MIRCKFDAHEEAESNLIFGSTYLYTNNPGPQSEREENREWQKFFTQPRQKVLQQASDLSEQAKAELEREKDGSSNEEVVSFSLTFLTNDSSCYSRPQPPLSFFFQLGKKAASIARDGDYRPSTAFASFLLLLLLLLRLRLKPTTQERQIMLKLHILLSAKAITLRVTCTYIRRMKFLYCSVRLAAWTKFKHIYFSPSFLV